MYGTRIGRKKLEDDSHTHRNRWPPTIIQRKAQSQNIKDWGPNQKMFKSKDRGRTQPIREVLEKSRETHFTIEKVCSIKPDWWNGVRTKRGQLGVAAGLCCLPEEFQMRRGPMKGLGRFGDKMRGKNGEFKKVWHELAPSHCLILFQKVNHLLRLLHSQVQRTQSKMRGQGYPGPNPGVWWTTLVLSLSLEPVWT